MAERDGWASDFFSFVSRQRLSSSRIILTQSALLLTVVVLLAQGAAAGHSLQDLLRRPPTSPIHVNTEFVLLDALVESKKSAPTVDTLSADDFQLTEAECNRRSVVPAP